MKDLQIIILAGGKGTRMNHPELPKVLVEANDKPLIDYLLVELQKLDLSFPIAVVTGYKSELVKEHLGNTYQFIQQDQQLGTGHAVAVCKSQLQDKSGCTIVFYADMPMITANLVKDIYHQHTSSKATLTMATIEVPDFQDWRNCFYQYGRILRDDQGLVQQIIELKNASEEQQNIREVNPGYYCFNSQWLWDNIPRLSKQNPQGEYLLTDLLAIAVSQSQPITTISIPPQTGLGVNTPEQLEFINNFLHRET